MGPVITSAQTTTGNNVCYPGLARRTGIAVGMKPAPCSCRAKHMSSPALRCRDTFPGCATPGSQKINLTRGLLAYETSGPTKDGCVSPHYALPNLNVMNNARPP